MAKKVHFLLFLFSFVSATTVVYAQSTSNVTEIHVPQITRVVVGLFGCVFVVFLTCLVGVCVYQLKRKWSTVIHPCDFVSCNEYKITIDDHGGLRETLTHEGNMVISIHDLEKATNNFSQDNILGRGGSATVYQGELKDGTKIAVKRTESVHEFKSEVSVLTKVRHTHLVALRGYCLDGDQRFLLAIEYMPQGT
ncbi:putative protein kinase RLK-Pelle-LRR-IX family [Helianthus anomalus]